MLTESQRLWDDRLSKRGGRLVLCGLLFVAAHLHVCTRLKLEFLICSTSEPPAFMAWLQVSTYQTACMLSCVQGTGAKKTLFPFSARHTVSPGTGSQQLLLFTEPFNGLNQPAESHSHHGPLCCRNKLNKHSTSLSSQKPLSGSPCRNRACSEGGTAARGRAESDA